MVVIAPNGQLASTRSGWGWLTILFLLLLALCALWIWYDQTELQLQWVIITIILIGLCVFSGWLVNGRADGILIDERNRISLARVQWIAWFIVLLGSYFAGAAWNVAYMSGWQTGQHFPNMQPDLWALLGIVSASAVASNLIVDKKKAESTAANPAGVPQPAQPPSLVQPDRIGSIDRNVTPGEASWADLFLGEEVSNRDVVDISRLQKLFVTVLLIVTYVRLLWTALGAPDVKTGFNMPPVSDSDGGHGFLWLLGISHAAYLTYKATPKSGPAAAASDNTDGCDVDFTANPTPDNQLPAASGGVAP